MARSLPAAQPGSHREAATHALPSDLGPLFANPRAAVDADEAASVQIFRAALNAYGGADALCAALLERDSYVSKISEAISGTKPVQLRWLWAMLRDPRAAAIIAPAVCAAAGYSPPVRERAVSEEEVRTALAEEVQESGLLDLLRGRLAARLGVRPEDVRL